jgi:hypothetical protein
MSEDIKDRLKSFVLGIVFPLALIYLAIPHLTGDRLRTRRGTILTPVQAFGAGLGYLGWGLCVHAFFYHRYENYPLVKWAVFASGVISFVVALFLQFA